MAPDPKQDGGPWTVGYRGPFRVTTSLIDEKEIDVDNKGVLLAVKIEMQSSKGLQLVAQDVKVTLTWDFTAQNIHFLAGAKGSKVLTSKTSSTEITSDKPGKPGTGQPFEGEVAVRTGRFSLPLKELAEKAIPGRKAVDVQIDYRLVPETFEDKTESGKAEATMQFVVARD